MELVQVLRLDVLRVDHPWFHLRGSPLFLTVRGDKRLVFAASSQSAGLRPLDPAGLPALAQLRGRCGSSIMRRRPTRGHPCLRPHRNVALGQASTEEELACLAAGELVHRPSFQG